jgi:hypothetical protein
MEWITNGTKLGAMIVAGLLLAVLPARGDGPFHNGGTGTCAGCHTTPPALLGSDPGSTCLLCHQAPLGVQLPTGSYVATDVRTNNLCVQLPPGGDFCWLKKNYRWSPGTGEVGTSPGDRHGHNIVALDFGYEADVTFFTAPGGIYPSAFLSCISCHDPHGNYRRNADGTITNSGLPIIASGSYSTSPNPTTTGSVGTYRLLAGKGYQPKSLAGNYAFTADPPAAVTPPLYNRSETSADTRVAFGSGMSEWCQNCHVRLHDTGGGLGQHSEHPAGDTGRLPVELINNYNFYIASGNLNGRPNAAYTSMVPFEMGTKDYDILKRVASSTSIDRNGPQVGATVMCLSCHRAHASGWDNITRWNMKTEFIVYNGLYPGIDKPVPAEYAQGRLSLETQKAFYDRPVTAYSLYQRGLCNKCHAKD